MNRGYYKFYRKMWDNPLITKDPEHIAVWVYLMSFATHQPFDVWFNGQRITLQPGQLVTGRKKIAEITHVEESKVKRILTEYKIAQQIDQQVTSHGSVITILKWNEYQKSDQQIDQQVTSQWPTSDQPVTTIQEYKEYKEQTNKHISTNADKFGLSVKDYIRARARASEAGISVEEYLKRGES